MQLNGIGGSTLTLSNNSSTVNKVESTGEKPIVEEKVRPKQLLKV